MKLYFDKDGESCYPLEHYLEVMKEFDLKEMELFEAKREIGSEYFFCKEYQEVGETRESCGKSCEGYKPNNGKSGRCKHYGYVYEATDTKIILRQ